jgi:hypothetical protein
LPDEKGYYTFYKAVTSNLKDFYTGKYQYKIGKGDICKLERNQAEQCGSGWHFSNFWNANAFGKDKQEPFKIISAKVHISDILSIYDKVRVKKFSNVKIININI